MLNIHLHIGQGAKPGPGADGVAAGVERQRLALDFQAHRAPHYGLSRYPPAPNLAVRGVEAIRGVEAAEVSAVATLFTADVGSSHLRVLQSPKSSKQGTAGEQARGRRPARRRRPAA